MSVLPDETFKEDAGEVTRLELTTELRVEMITQTFMGISKLVERTKATGCEHAVINSVVAGSGTPEVHIGEVIRGTERSVEIGEALAECTVNSEIPTILVHTHPVHGVPTSFSMKDEESWLNRHDDAFVITSEGPRDIVNFHPIYMVVGVDLDDDNGRTISVLTHRSKGVDEDLRNSLYPRNDVERRLIDALTIADENDYDIKTFPADDLVAVAEHVYGHLSNHIELAPIESTPSEEVPLKLDLSFLRRGEQK